MRRRWHTIGWAAFVVLHALAARAVDPPAAPPGSIFDPPPTTRPTVVRPKSPPAAPTSAPGIAKATQRVFTTDDKLTGDLALDAAGGPFEIKGKLGPAEGLKKYTIQIGAGADVHGGSILIQNGGHAVIAGTPDHPAVLRDLTFEQALGGNFIATCAIFENCKFRKVGGWYAYHSSKWTFEQCAIHGPAGFSNLKGVDYGFKFNDCTFQGLTFPEIGGRAPKDKPLDHMLFLRADWNKITRCRFDDCVVPPTVFWCSEFSDFTRCHFIPGVAFESDAETQVKAYVEGTVGDPPEKVFASNPAKRAGIRVVFAPQPFPVFAFPGKQ